MFFFEGFQPQNVLVMLFSMKYYLLMAKQTTDFNNESL